MKKTFAALIASLASLPALAAEIPVPITERTALGLTIYNEDLGMVRETRTLPIAAGRNGLALEGVPSRLIPRSVVVRPAAASPSFDVVGVDFSSAVVGLQSLLERSVGREVGWVTVNPATGAETVRRATVMSVQEGLVLAVDGKVEAFASPADLPGRIVFDELPPGLRARPTLLVQVDGRKAGAEAAEIAYLTGGLSWQADYTAELAPAGGSLHLRGWAGITNDSGADFSDARVQLAAGSINRARTAPQPKFMARAMAAAPAMEAGEPEAAGGLYLYDLPEPVSLADRETKQVPLFKSRTVRTAIDYTVEIRRPMERETFENADRYLRIVNDDASGLGMPLPAGVFRAYGRDRNGVLQFQGEANLPNLPAGERARLRLGTEFDISARRVQTEEAREPARYVQGFRISLNNARSEEVTVAVVESIGHRPFAALVQESQPHAEQTANTIEWRVRVPARGKAELSYRIAWQR